MSTKNQAKKSSKVVKTVSAKTTTAKLEAVVVRTYSAGVHFGFLLNRKGMDVTLVQTRRIWSWQGRYTLNEIANNGVGAGSKVSEEVSKNILTQAIEIISCTPEAVDNLKNSKWVA